MKLSQTLLATLLFMSAVSADHKCDRVAKAKREYDAAVAALATANTKAKKHSESLADLEKAAELAKAAAEAAKKNYDEKSAAVTQAAAEKAACADDGCTTLAEEKRAGLDAEKGELETTMKGKDEDYKAAKLKFEEKGAPAAAEKVVAAKKEMVDTWANTGGVNVNECPEHEKAEEGAEAAEEGAVNLLTMAQSLVAIAFLVASY